MHQINMEKKLCKSEVTTIQDRVVTLIRKISLYYERHYPLLVHKEYERLTRSTLQAHLKYEPSSIRLRLQEIYLHRAMRNVSQRRDDRINKVTLIVQCMQSK